jgi:hypothetical protein
MPWRPATRSITMHWPRFQAGLAEAVLVALLKISHTVTVISLVPKAGINLAEHRTNLLLHARSELALHMRKTVTEFTGQWSYGLSKEAATSVAQQLPQLRKVRIGIGHPYHRHLLQLLRRWRMEWVSA